MSSLLLVIYLCYHAPRLIPRVCVTIYDCFVQFVVQLLLRQDIIHHDTHMCAGEYLGVLCISSLAVTNISEAERSIYCGTDNSVLLSILVAVNFFQMHVRV